MVVCLNSFQIPFLISQLWKTLAPAPPATVVWLKRWLNFGLRGNVSAHATYKPEIQWDHFRHDTQRIKSARQQRGAGWYRRKPAADRCQGWTPSIQHIKQSAVRRHRQLIRVGNIIQWCLRAPPLLASGCWVSGPQHLLLITYCCNKETQRGAMMSFSEQQFSCYHREAEPWETCAVVMSDICWRPIRNRFSQAVFLRER